MSQLTDLIERLAKLDFSQSSEPDTRERSVNPIIGALGWDTLGGEVVREYSVRSGGRVDYCLRVNERSAVLIEVNRAGFRQCSSIPHLPEREPVR